MSTTEKTDCTITTPPSYLAKNLSALMEHHHITIAELARTLKLPHNTVRRLITGEITNPRLSTLTLIAHYFDVSLDTLTDNHYGQPIDTQKKAYRSVPIFNWNDIANDEFFKTINRNHWKKWQPIPLTNSENLSEHAYALESRKSMQRRFPEGSLFIIDPKEKAIDTDLVLIRINSTHEITLRDLVIDPPNSLLKPITREGPDIILDKEEHTIIGVVILTTTHSRQF